jgi:hypothetical protein
LENNTKDLFAKYDLRSLADTTKRLTAPSGSTYEYDYQFLWMSKATAYQIITETYVQKLYYREKAPSVSIFRNIQTKSWKSDRMKSSFDAQGKRVEASHGRFSGFIVNKYLRVPK